MKQTEKKYAVMEYDYDTDKFVIKAEGTRDQCADYVFEHYDDPFDDDDVQIVRYDVACKIANNETLTDEEFDLLPCSMWILI